MPPPATRSSASPRPNQAVTWVASSRRPVSRHTTALATRPPSSGNPGSRLKAARTRLASPSSAIRSPGQPATSWLASHSRPARLTEVSGPAMAISASPAASVGSLTIRATPPNTSRLISMVATPRTRAASACASSCARTEAKNAQVKTTERATAPGPVTRGDQTSWLSATKIARPTNQERSRRTGKPKIRPSRSPRPSTPVSPSLSPRAARTASQDNTGCGGGHGGRGSRRSGAVETEARRRHVTGALTDCDGERGGEPPGHAVADGELAGAEVGGQPPGGGGGGDRRGAGRHAVLDGQTAQHQGPGLAVVFGIHARDQPAIGEYRHRVVAVLALGGRHVHLYPVAEAEQALGALARPDERVERAQQHRWVLGPARDRRAGLHVRRLGPAAYGDVLEQTRAQRLGQRRPGQLRPQAEVVGEVRRGADAERAGGQHGQLDRGLVRGRRGQVEPGREHPLGKVVAALEADPVVDQEHTGVEEVLEDVLGRGPVPPGAAAAPTRLAEVGGRERPLVADALEDRLIQFAVFAASVSPPAAGLRGHPRHARQKQAEGLDR